jgi:ATP-dependent helicase HrpA
LPRLVKALGVRAERARLSAEKDRAKAAQVEPFEAEYARLARLLGREYSPEKEKLLFDLRWMIEEFKVSLFAPEIKTAFPVSAKRLAAKIKEIEAILERRVGEIKSLNLRAEFFKLSGPGLTLTSSKK